MNNYHLYEEIGHGKHSTIYKGRRKYTIHYVAIKSIEKTKRSRVITEYSIGNELADVPSLCGVYEWHETRNHLWIVTELCAGGDLLRILKQDGLIQEEIQVGIFFAQVARAMLEMHAKGIVFADMKPGNVLFTEAGQIKLSGFGVAQRIADIEQALQSSGGNHGLPRRGSPFYMAPELFDESGFHSIASDIYGFGCVLCEIVSGKTPYSQCTSFSQLCDQINRSTASQIDFPPAILSSPSLHSLLTQMLAKNPANRITWTQIANHAWVKSMPSVVPTHEWENLIRKTAPVEERFARNYFARKSTNQLAPKIAGRHRRNSSVDSIGIGTAAGCDGGGSATPTALVYRNIPARE